MLKKIIAALLALSAIPMLTGCDRAARIDKAAAVEAITVEPSEDGALYRFYLLDGDSAETICESLKAACEKAEQIMPTLSLMGVEQLIYLNDADGSRVTGDLEYIASDYRFSPLIKIALADPNTFERLDKGEITFEEIKTLISDLKDSEDISDTVLSVYNKIKSGARELMLAELNTENETVCAAADFFNE